MVKNFDNFYVKRIKHNSKHPDFNEIYDFLLKPFDEDVKPANVLQFYLPENQIRKEYDLKLALHRLTMRDGETFGELAIINNEDRAATIVSTSQPCHTVILS